MTNDIFSLVKKVRNNDSEALKQLCQKYLPMIMVVRGRYYLRDYDFDDWYQEAMLVCYDAVMAWQDDRKSFGSFFKLCLNNHARTLLRYQEAQRRLAFTHSCSYEAAYEAGAVVEPGSLGDNGLPLSDSLHDFIIDLSELEFMVLTEYLGQASHEEIKQHLQLSDAALMRAKSRLVRKLKAHLF
jgi:RNA polymerase sporulation-specific sigma factor